MSIRADLITSSEKEKKITSHNVIYPTIIELNERDLMLMKLFQIFASWANYDSRFDSKCIYSNVIYDSIF